MKIAGAKKEPQYSGNITVDWVSPSKYRLIIQGPEFRQTRVIDGEQVQEESVGNFYPGWLHSFVLALLDPLSVKSLLLDPKAALEVSRSANGDNVSVCVTRDNKQGGIRDDMTWSGICLTNDGRLLNSHDFRTWMDFSDFKSFAGKKIARSYQTSTGSYDEIKGVLTSLKPLSTADADAIHAAQATGKDKQTAFRLISNKDLENRIESAKPFEWPTIREGKTDGYMIVHVLTDVTGQVRETSKYNSDNPGLEEAGLQAAMGYKFKPLLLDGVPAQIEGPLVLHFTSKIFDPLPTLRGADLLPQVRGCNAKLVNSQSVTAGKPTHISVNELGKLTGEGFGPQVNIGDPAVVITLPPDTVDSRPHALDLDCTFTPLIRNSVATYYHGDLLVIQSK